jgi:hypothetical protein
MLKIILNNTNSEITTLSEEYRIKSNAYDTFTKLTLSYNENNEKLEFQLSYLKIANCKTGLPSIILKRTAQILENKCNEVLRKIADFTMKVKYDVDIKIYTVENDIMIPATMASGAQKFCCDLILRIVLTELSHVSCTNMLFVDEGFGSLDKEAFINVANILQKLKHKFDALFIISHISELKAYCDKSINITKRGIYSNVQFGSLTDAQKNITLVNESMVNNKRISEFKTSGKDKKQVVHDTNDKNTKLIDEFISNNGGIEKILLKDDDVDASSSTGTTANSGIGEVYCNGCQKKYKNKKGFKERHVTSVTNKAKHNKYILSLIMQR